MYFLILVSLNAILYCSRSLTPVRWLVRSWDWSSQPLACLASHPGYRAWCHWSFEGKWVRLSFRVCCGWALGRRCQRECWKHCEEPWFVSGEHWLFSSSPFQDFLLLLSHWLNLCALSEKEALTSTAEVREVSCSLTEAGKDCLQREEMVGL